MGSLEKISGGETTGIGSLPHHNIDAALEYAFQYSLPFLPQIPMRNPWEFSLPQGLEGLPGLRIESDGMPFVDMSVWVGLAKPFDEKLGHAFERAMDESAFESFEPSSATSSSWQPFLWELQERNALRAKVQIVGPLTAQWSLRSTDGERVDSNPDIGRQIFQLILARALGMIRRLKTLGVTPLLFLDEPAFFVYNGENPHHLVGMQQLRVLVQALQKEGALVGLHCCSNTQWAAVLGLGADFLSIDTALSLPSLLQAKEALLSYVEKGGRLSLGVVPTNAPKIFSHLSAESLMGSIQEVLSTELGSLSEKILSQALWTPACGLALHTPKDAQTIYSLLGGCVSAFGLKASVEGKR
jgi:hypothetical protein